MKKLVRVDAEALDEISHAIDFYDEQRPGLGADFWSEVDFAITALAEPGPECGSVLALASAGVRRKLLARFPYAIVFIELATTVRVIAVTHGHRRPAYWRRRI